MANMNLPRKLRELRESVGLSVGEAARKLNFSSYQTLTNIEEGKRQLKASELPLFSKAYFCSLSTLLDEQPAHERPSLLWRKTPPDNERKNIEAKILYYCEQYTLLEKLLGMTEEKEFRCMEVKVDNLRSNFDIDSLADEIRSSWELGGRPALSLSSIMEQRYGIKIVYHALGDIGSGASILHPEYGPVVVINSDEAPWRRNYDLAHELFHLVTWNAFAPEDLKDPKYFDDIEKKAERFASTILLPDAEVRRSINLRLKKEALTYSDLVDIAREFGVSTIALLFRLSNLRLLNFETAKDMADDEELHALDRRARKNEWGGDPNTTRFYFLAAKCLRKGLISRGKFSAMVEINRADVDNFLRDIGVMEEEGAKIEIMVA